MFTGLLHTHTLFVVLYLLLLLIKTVLLLAGKTETLDKFREKTKIWEMVIATIFLLTGIGLWTQSAAVNTAFFWVKIILVIAIIPLGIVVFKKKSKSLGLLPLLLFVYVYGISETKSLTFNTNPVAIYSSEDVQVPSRMNPDSEDYDQMAHGKKIYQKHCTSCHGEEGDLNKSGANDLTNSEMKMKGIKSRIRDGRKSMPAYGNILSKKEIQAVGSYLREKIQK